MFPSSWRNKKSSWSGKKEEGRQGDGVVKRKEVPANRCGKGSLGGKRKSRRKSGEAEGLNCNVPDYGAKTPRLCMIRHVWSRT